MTDTLTSKILTFPSESPCSADIKNSRRYNSTTSPGVA